MSVIWRGLREGARRNFRGRDGPGQRGALSSFWSLTVKVPHFLGPGNLKKLGEENRTESYYGCPIFVTILLVNVSRREGGEMGRTRGRFRDFIKPCDYASHVNGYSSDNLLQVGLR